MNGQALNPRTGQPPNPRFAAYKAERDRIVTEQTAGLRKAMMVLLFLGMGMNFLGTMVRMSTFGLLWFGLMIASARRRWEKNNPIQSNGWTSAAGGGRT